MNVNVHVIPVLLLMNIHVHAGSRAIFFSDPRMFFHHYLRGRRWGAGFSGRRGHRRRRLLTSGDPD
jgi:hypothetical protein